jgi:cephalosporin-C deacetylase-like acetyl esterase
MKNFLSAMMSTVRFSAAMFAQLPPQADTLFRYDQHAPLELRDSLIESMSQWNVYEVSYARSRSGRVTGYLLSPTEKGPHAAILFGHWGPGSRTEFLPEAKLYAQAGVHP